ncbi:hypothetical protein [Streptomyces sp. NPDC051561]
MSTRRFLVLVTNLPSESGFARAWRSTPRAVSDPAEIAAITGLPAG